MGIGGGTPRVRAEGQGQRQNLAQEDLFNFLNSVIQNFGAGGTGPGTKAAKRLLRSELELSRKFGGALAEQQRELIAQDPILSRLSQGAQKGLDRIFGGLGTAGRLPGDIRSNLTSEIRGSLASRGILESPSGALEEAVRLAGGREAFRAQRIAQAAPFISAGLNLGQQPRNFSPLGQFAPSASGLFQGQLQSRQISAGVAAQNAQLKAQGQQGLGQLLGAGLGAAATIFSGGAAAPLFAGQLLQAGASGQQGLDFMSSAGNQLGDAFGF